MHLDISGLTVDLIEATEATGDLYGAPGWYWHESTQAPRGPFSSAAAAIADLARWVDRMSE